MGIILIRSVINLKNSNRIKITYKNDFERVVEKDVRTKPTDLRKLT